MVDDPQSASEIMCSWCMCVGGELVEWVVDESEASVVVFSILR